MPRERVVHDPDSVLPPRAPASPRLAVPHALTTLLQSPRATRRQLQQDQELLWAAGRTGDAKTVRTLLASKTFLGSPRIDKNATETASGGTTLMHASYQGHRSVVSALLDAKADVQAQDARNGSTALMYAAAFGHLNIARLLVDRGASLHTTDSNGFDALGVAEQHGRPEVARFLRKAAELMAQKQEQLLEAATSGDESTVFSLLASQVEPNTTDPEGGETPLIFASGKGHEAIAKALIDAKADVDATDSAGWTSLMWASEGGHLSTIKLLLGARADPGVADADGNTALVISRAAVEQGDYSLTEAHALLLMAVKRFASRQAPSSTACVLS